MGGHFPLFTPQGPAQLNPMIEAYQTGATYEELQSLVQPRYINLIREVLKETVQF